MNKGYEVIDLPVVNLETGKEIGDVKDVVFDPDTERIVGLIVEGGGFFKGDRMIPYDQLYSMGDDAVTIKDESALSDLDDTKDYLIDNPGDVIGSKVVTDDGKELGIIEDIILNPDDGNRDSYEITDGLVHDILDGRGVLSVSNELKYGEDVVVVSNLEDYQELNNQQSTKEE
ncbi:PRC-barrel domain-containing protein [Acetohalobium arabaticum]|uniref:PRC-barrel domain protein n=1 Tax=Acetohalobium arabaticum (strain ATCC 49924 / DSM 5501 / Z-7288) TaxID=574087 RepID=D9QUP6_ACEAZ|nr:PRC-barrel domain-containing protein [Acetohalobium arabaticum]ADL11955.1 PRC-barrel domain protein [Acetohalobium arabaticum DSM 5501]